MLNKSNTTAFQHDPLNQWSGYQRSRWLCLQRTLYKYICTLILNTVLCVKYISVIAQFLYWGHHTACLPGSNSMVWEIFTQNHWTWTVGHRKLVVTNCMYNTHVFNQRHHFAIKPVKAYFGFVPLSNKNWLIILQYYQTSKSLNWLKHRDCAIRNTLTAQ